MSTSAKKVNNERFGFGRQELFIETDEKFDIMNRFIKMKRFKYDTL